MNLVTNAFEAMPEGGRAQTLTANHYIDRTVSGFENVDEGEYVLLTVTDAGVGISPEDQERIFEPFFTKKVLGHSGTGLGMAVVWGVVKDLKGLVDVQSARAQAPPSGFSSRSPAKSCRNMTNLRVWRR